MKRSSGVLVNELQVMHARRPRLRPPPDLGSRMICTCVHRRRCCGQLPTSRWIIGISDMTLSSTTGLLVRSSPRRHSPWMFLLIILLVFTADESLTSSLCQRNICLNGGSCIVRDDNSFGCKCLPGYGGLICEVKCGCVHGECDADTRLCTCQKGWIGLKCDIEQHVETACTKDIECPSDQRCVEGVEGSLVCAVDTCRTTNCMHSASCSIRKGVAVCECTAAYRGRLCEEDVNECLSNPCMNDGKCVNKVGGFSCECGPMYTGVRCEHEKGCESACPGGTCVASLSSSFHCLCPNSTLTSSARCHPKSSSACGDCLNDGVCVKRDGRAVCECPPLFSGVACEKESECTVNGKGCSNGGECIRRLTSSVCECVEGWEGENCDRRSVNPSASGVCSFIHCANGGRCESVEGEPRCVCVEGYSGTWCEVDGRPPSTCMCLNGGSCTQDGCACMEGFTGKTCEQRISLHSLHTTHSEPEITSTTPSTTSSSVTTSSPVTTISPTFPSISLQPDALPQVTCSMCVHSTECVDTLDGWLCLCKDGYTGPLCDDPTPSCASMSCASGEQCVRESTLFSSRLFCGCPLPSPQCASLSSFTFSPSSLFVHQSAKLMIGSSSGALPYDVSFSFRTTLHTVHIVSGEDLFGSTLYSLHLQDGLLRMNVSSVSYPLLPSPVNNASWFAVNITKTQKDVFVSLWSEGGRRLFSRLLPRPSSFDVFSTRFGRLSSSSFFVGCIGRVFIDGEERVLSQSQRAVNITKGCPRESQCAPSPCGNGGECVDEWSTFSCVCTRPFLPPLCKHSLPPFTLGHLTPSSATVAIEEPLSTQLQHDSSVSVMVRTMQRDAPLIALYEKTSHSDDRPTFLSLEIVNSTLHGRIRVGRRPVVDVDSHVRVDDNEEHLVAVERRNGRITVSVDGMEGESAALDGRYDFPLFTDSLIIASTHDAPLQAFSHNYTFKGFMQDIRLNDVPIPLSSSQEHMKIVREENLLQGVVVDDVCASSSPCVNGECVNVWNTFRCACHAHWEGERCDERDHCANVTCPLGDSCYSLPHTHICVSPVTLLNDSFATFVREAAIPIDRVAFSIRTHSDTAAIMSFDGVYSISLVDGRLSLFSPSSSLFSLRLPLNDGAWHNISIHNNIVSIDGDRYGVPLSSRLSLPSISSLRVGSSVTSPSFAGCINNVTLNSSPIPLSFKSLSTPINGWSVDSKHRMDTSTCHSIPQCGAFDACLNGGTCEDRWNKRVCVCPVGLSGALCEKEVNECDTKQCMHGQCVDHLARAECVCAPGWSGALCEVPLDLCATSPCLNGGQCSSLNETFKCTCPRGFHGRTCALQGAVECSSSTCGNGGECKSSQESFSCVCVDGWSGEECEVPPSPCLSSPCGFHGTCTTTPSNGFTCQCLPGYTGRHCESLIERCSHSCSHHGSCLNAFNTSICTCDEGYGGRDCSLTVDGCALIPCSNDGVCSESGNGRVSCACPPFYLGDTCSVRGSCASSPCVHGVCHQQTPTVHTCECAQGYKGDTCEEEVDICESSPCANGATCTSSHGSFVCSCPMGFDGTLCDHEVDECLSSPCQHGGTCIDRVAAFHCHCPDNYSGRTCELDVDECQSSEMCVHGQCANSFGSYKCTCSTGWVGRKCTLRDPCYVDAKNRSSHMCVHGGCINSTVQWDGKREWTDHSCECFHGYAGAKCSTKVDESRVPLGYIVGPVIVVLIVLSILGCTLLVFTLKGNASLQGHYSPSHQEHSSIYPMGTMLKLPPEERLI